MVTVGGSERGLWKSLVTTGLIWATWNVRWILMFSGRVSVAAVGLIKLLMGNEPMATGESYQDLVSRGIYWKRLADCWVACVRSRASLVCLHVSSQHWMCCCVPMSWGLLVCGFLETGTVSDVLKKVGTEWTFCFYYFQNDKKKYSVC